MEILERLWRAALIFLIGLGLLEAQKQIPVEWLSEVLHEIGFALLVSAVVWLLFEFHTAHENEIAWNERIERISKNVFLSVLQKDLPKALIDEARSLVLDQSLIRTKLASVYTFNDQEYVLDAKVTPCVILNAAISFDLKNVSALPVDYSVAVALPNPVVPELQEMTLVHDITVIQNGQACSFNLPQAQEQFAKALRSSDSTSVRFVAGVVKILPGQSIAVRANYDMAKECEDTEFLQTIYPADGMQVTVVDHSTKRKRSIFGKAVHRVSIETQKSVGKTSTQIFRINDHLLPHQGILIWWKEVGDFRLTPPMPEEVT